MGLKPVSMATAYADANTHLMGFYNPKDYETVQDYYGLYYLEIHYHHNYCRANAWLAC